MSRPLEIEAQSLTQDAFRPFGDVIEARGQSQPINDGTAERFEDVARLDLLGAGGAPQLGIVRALPVNLPLLVNAMERHPRASQMFMPLDGSRFLVVVAPPGDALDALSVRAFLASGSQGVNYRRNTWHHSLVTLDREADFLVLDRADIPENCEVRAVLPTLVVRAPT